MRFKFVFSAEWPSLPQCLALCLNIIIHSFILHTVACLRHIRDGSYSGVFFLLDTFTTTHQLAEGIYGVLLLGFMPKSHNSVQFHGMFVS